MGCNRYSLALTLWVLGWFLPSLLSGQERISRAGYIESFAGIAMEEMRLHGIPASIKLAQALLESDDGNSLLARKANNHFGIKCHQGWDGPVFHKDDDEKNECFRGYKSADLSFRDHSYFLTSRARYKGLFSLSVLDYEGWAKGLKEAGYATNPTYAEMLVKIIRDNGLDRYDTMVYRGQPMVAFEDKGRVKRNRKDREEDFDPVQIGDIRDVFLENRVKFVIAGETETYSDIAASFDLAIWMIRKFNEVTRTEEPRAGQRVYIAPKRKMHPKEQHYATGKESLYDISMRYAVRVKRLEKYNQMERTAVPAAGTLVRLSR